MAAPAVVPPSRVLVEASIAPLWWRRSAVRAVRADDHGNWCFQLRNGASLCIRPTRIDIGPGGLWLSLSGPVDQPGSTMPAPGASSPGRCARFAGPVRRRRFTLWAVDAGRDDWRRLRIAALWRTHRAGLPHE